MSEAMTKYRALQKRLTMSRWLHGGYESEEEDQILDEMDVVWYEMAISERDTISAEPSRNDLIRPAEQVIRVRDVVVQIGHAEPVRHLVAAVA